MTAPTPPPTEARDRLARDWRLFTIGVFTFTFGFAIYNGVFQNYLKDVVNARPLDLGILESLRELPGLCTALMAMVLYALAEARVAAIGLLITAIGIASTGFFRELTPVVISSVVWSIGFHLYATMQSPITLTLAKGQEGGRHLGRMTGVGAMATIAALAFAWGVSFVVPRSDYLFYFVVAGVLILVAAVCLLSLSQHAAGGKRQRLIFRREYGLFYWLTFLEGCRRQIFAIFASYTLILVYKVPLDQMLALQLINAILIAITAPRMGRLLDRVGERTPLMIYAVGLIAVFAGYSTVTNVAVLMVLYIIDNVLFTFGAGFTMYLHRIVRPGELTPCVAMGVTMNHIAAVTVPIGGAILWTTTQNYQAAFAVGLVIAVVALISTTRLPFGPAPAKEPATSS